MKNKRTLWIAIALAIVAIVIILFALKPSGTETKAEDTAVTEDAVQTSAPVVEPSPTAGGEVSAESAEEEESSVAQLIENEGDIEIIIPEDQASDGF